MKKALCLLLALVMVFSMLPMSAMADGENFFMHSLVFPNDDGGYTENAQILPLSFFSGIVGDTSFIKLYYGNRDSQTPLQAGELISSDSSIIAVTRMSDDNIGAFYKLECLASGDATLTYTEGEVSYSQNVSVTENTSSEEPVVPSGPGIAFYSQRSMDSQYLVNIGKLNILETGTSLWLMSAEGFTLDQVNTLSVTAEPASKTPVINPVLRDGSTDRYDIAVELVQPDAAGAVVGGYNLNFFGLYDGGFRVCIEAEGYPLQAGGYYVNFGSYDKVSNILTIHEPENVYFYNTEKAANPDNPYVSLGEYQVFAGTWQTDSEGITVYKLAEDVSLEIVSARIETLYGDEATFSFSQSALVKSLGEGPDSVSPVTHLEMYVKEGYTGYCKLWAYVNVIQNDKSIAYSRISLVFTADRENNISFDYEADLASGVFSGTITEYLKYITDNYIDEETYPIRNFTVTLGNKLYTEDVVIDARFNDNDNLTLVGSLATIIEGSIDLNGTANQKIRNINLRADSDSNNVGIFGGHCFIDSCSFYNFDIALSDTDDLHSSVKRCVFINNDIAWNIDTNGRLMNIHSYNTFINNTVAVNVSCTHSENSSYYFRIMESNFINNGIDISGDTGSTLYMYRNYFGQYKLVDDCRPGHGKYHGDKCNGKDHLRLDELLAARTESKLALILESRPAQLDADTGTSIIANPRWKFPVVYWWHMKMPINQLIFDSVSVSLMSIETEEEYVNILISDWENETEIINEEADELVIDASAFETECEKEITVVDQDSLLGTWTFE